MKKYIIALIVAISVLLIISLVPSDISQSRMEPGGFKNEMTSTPEKTLLAISTKTPESEGFNGQRAFIDVKTQMELGPRIPGSEAHAKVIGWISNEVKNAGWQVEIQNSSKMDHPITNIIAKRGNGKPWIIIGAHYDSRLWEVKDPDPENIKLPVPGAVDGASGVAVLTELARSLPPGINKEIWLIFFDAEDQGKIPGWDWILGSRVAAESLQSKPEAVIVVDMIGDADLNVYFEHNSDETIMTQIWDQAAKLGYGSNIIAKYKYTMLDDHIPFKELGIPAVDMIDFDYPYWHTTQDTLDKVSPQSLQVIGDTLWNWIQNFKSR